MVYKFSCKDLILGKLDLIASISDKQAALNQLVIEGSSVFVKLCYSGLFLMVVIAF